ncbi:flagellar brake protein [Clostridium cylindrosporum]|uniref:Putative glycosyltransferase n=1 Tax=Clostridium cylindrosporum DSM 605 TaxID=1121307 RepID=A0A0J8D749_CLOCY|nr:PilZ domain-containing protein [Clostridium cylindrosporum]KMT21717.1 putative glycosyltransferase [Clostridium cylindrosporum DSM 605]
MKNKNKLRINERVEFVVEDEIYKSTIQDIISENSIAISVPVNGAKSHLPHIRASVEFFVFLKNEYHNYKGKIVNRIIDGNLRLLIIDELEYKGKIQRREDYRIPISLDVSYLPVKKEVVEKGISKKIIELLEDKFKSAKSIDISAGGIKLITTEEIEAGTYIITRIKSNFIEDISTVCKVIRVEKDLDMKIYKMGCRFENLDKLDKEKIVRFIFEKSRELMKR